MIINISYNVPFIDISLSLLKVLNYTKIQSNIIIFRNDSLLHADIFIVYHITLLKRAPFYLTLHNPPTYDIKIPIHRNERMGGGECYYTHAIIYRDSIQA